MAKPPTPAPTDMLSALPAELSSRLFAKVRPVSLGADQTLFLAGDAGDGCYRVDEGLLKASVLSPTGGERILAIFGPGAVIGELSMIDGAVRSATVTALRDAKLQMLKSFGPQAVPKLWSGVLVYGDGRSAVVPRTDATASRD